MASGAMEKAMSEVDSPLYDMHDGSKRLSPMSSSSVADSDLDETARMKNVLDNSSIPGIYGGSRSRSKKSRSKKSRSKKSRSKKSRSKKSKKSKK
jgi:hypothetical protein